jgi:hypothetical protein
MAKRLPKGWRASVISELESLKGYRHYARYKSNSIGAHDQNGKFRSDSQDLRRSVNNQDDEITDRIIAYLRGVEYEPPKAKYDPWE